MINDAHAAGEKSQAALSSLAAAFFLTCLKLAAGLSTNSLGILSEALHSGLDLLAAGITFAAVRIAAIPADSSHPYGHGKVEHLAALAETALLLLTCGWIIGEALTRLFTGEAAVTPSPWAFAVMAISIVVDISRSRMLRRTAEKHKSQALAADALHFASDVWSSFVVLIGLGAMWFARTLPQGSTARRLLEHADTVAALAVAAIVLRACFRLSKDAVDSLMDREHEDIRKIILDCLKEVAGIVRVERARIRVSGPAHFVDLALAVDASLGLDAAHAVASRAEEAVIRCLPGADVTVHVEPVHLPGSGIRSELSVINDLAREHGLTVRSALFTPHPGGTRAELHVEAPAQLELVRAHEKVDALEAAVRKELSVERVITRLEPALDPRERDAPRSENSVWVHEAVTSALAELPMLSEGHSVRLYAEHVEDENEPSLYAVSLHCRMAGDASVLQAHEAATALECRLRLLTAGRLGRVLIHVEPLKEVI